MRAASLTLCLLVSGPAAGTGVVNLVEATHANGRYAVILDVDVDAEPDRVRAIALDHDGLHRLSSAIVSSARLPATAADPDRRRIVYRSCFLIHCIDAVIVEAVRTPESGRILTFVEPALSDFLSGHGIWELTSLGAGRTRVHMTAELEPRFWVPPVVGPWLIKRKMRSAAEETGLKLEELARDE